MTSPYLYFLGLPRFTRGDRTVELTVVKAIALLAYLAVTRAPQTRDHVLALLWPDSQAEAARKNLRNTLWAIRKAFGDDVLDRDNGRLSLRDIVWVDLREFENLVDTRLVGTDRSSSVSVRDRQTAVDLYGGFLLDGLTLSDAPEFEIWLATERERLGQLYLRALEALVAAHRGAANWAGMIAVARRALLFDNLQEPMYRALMEAHARLGERPEALRQYDVLRAVLDRELGVEPLAETDALRLAIMSGDLQPAARTGRAGPGPFRRQHLAGGSVRTPFVGRRVERAVLEAEFQLATSGQARVVLLIGEVGIGKSRLWHEWAAPLAANSVVLESRCLESLQALPFAPLTELFRRHACIQRLFTPQSPVPSIWLAEVARLVPEIRPAFPELPAPPTLPPTEERRRIFEAFVQCLLALDARPLIFFIDDLHWADRATLGWLDYLVHRLRDRPLLLVAAYRPQDATAQLVQFAVGWGRAGIARRVVLPRLTNEEASALIASLGGDPGLTACVQAQSAGNPYFLIELVRAAPGEIPLALAELVRARLDRLPGGARQVLQAAAVLEPEFDFMTLRRTSGRGEEETLDALDALLDAAVLTEQATNTSARSLYAFAHPLVARVVRDGLSGARRVFLHRRAAIALETTHASHLAQIAGQLAMHYTQAAEPARAAMYAEMAAERALALAAPAEAADFYRQALALDSTPARQLGLGRALFRHGDLDGARIAFDAALSGFEALGDRRQLARTCLDLAETYVPVGRTDDVVGWVQQGLAFLDVEADPAAHAQAHFLLATARLVTEPSLGEAEVHLAEAVRLASEHDLIDMAARSRFELGNLLAQRGDLAGALQAFRDSIALARAAGNQLQEILGHNNTAYHALLAGDLAAAQEHIETGLALAEARALRLPLVWLYSTRGEIALAEKEWAEAEEWFNRGVAEAERRGNLNQVANYQANLGLAARGRGDLDGALMLLEAARASVERLTAPHLQTQIDLWLVELYLERGEDAAAKQALTRAEVRLVGGERARLQAWVEQLRGVQATVSRVAE
ncbi:MAG TPA: hypothetical protein DEP84_28435 [Chloroflexi bacterium]|nr:hypothetical protein [Chloroflexota bacterium]